MVKFWSFRQLTIIKRKFRDGSVEKLSMGLAGKFSSRMNCFPLVFPLHYFFRPVQAGCPVLLFRQSLTPASFPCQASFGKERKLIRDRKERLTIPKKILVVRDSRHFFPIPIKFEHPLATLVNSSSTILIRTQSLLRTQTCSPGGFEATVEARYERCSIHTLKEIWRYQSIVR